MKKILYCLLFVSHLGHAMSLHDACGAGNVFKVKELLERDRAQVNEKKDGFSPIHLAAYAESPEIIKLLLDAEPSLINETDARGNIPFTHLFLAIFDWRKQMKGEKMAEEIVKMGFLKRVAPESLEDQMARQLRSFKAKIELFIERGADLDKANNFGCTWDKMPGLDAELADYARSLIKGQKVPK